LPTAGDFHVLVPVNGGIIVAPVGCEAGLGITAFDIPNNTAGLVLFWGGTFADGVLNQNERMPLKVLIDAGLDVRIGDRLTLSNSVAGLCEVDGIGQVLGRAVECLLGNGSPVLCAVNRSFINAKIVI
jgi:hypothetical protein